MVIFQYNLYIFGIHLKTVLYPKLCYNKLCYKEVEVYIVKLGFTAVYIIFIAPACSRVRYRRSIFRPSVRPSVRQSVRPSVSPSVRLSTFMSTFDIYVKVSILINYKTKQPSNLAWNLTSWLCNIGVRFSVCLSIHPSVCQHLCRRSTFMSKLVF